MEIIPTCFVLCVNYDLITVSKNALHFRCTLLRLPLTYSGLGTYSQATPGLLNMCIKGRYEFASKQL